MPTATNAVPNPSAEITSSVTPAAQRWVSGAKSASTATGADKSGTHQVATPGRNSCQPAMSGVGMPAARRPRPVGSAATCGPAHGTPGSANRPNTSPVRTWSMINGAKSTTVGMTSQMSRATPFPPRITTDRMIAPVHTTAKAGASDGAHATTAASSSEATPEATQVRCAMEPA